MRSYKSDKDIYRTKCTIVNSCSYIKSFEFNNRLINVTKLKSKPTLKPRYIIYFKDDFDGVGEEWNDVKLICEISAKIIDTNSMKNIYTYCFTGKNSNTNLVKLIMEKLNEI